MGQLTITTTISIIFMIIITMMITIINNNTCDNIMIIKTKVYSDKLTFLLNFSLSKCSLSRPFSDIRLLLAALVALSVDWWWTLDITLSSCCLVNAELWRVWSMLLELGPLDLSVKWTWKKILLLYFTNFW